MQIVVTMEGWDMGSVDRQALRSVTGKATAIW